MRLDLLSHLQSRIFAFGDYGAHAYGWLRFDAGQVVSASYANPRESFYRLDGTTLEFLCSDRLSVSSRLDLAQMEPLLFHGAPVGASNHLYLREEIALPPRQFPLPAPFSRPAVLVNTVPKAGTYFVQRAFQELGFQPTDLHLGNALLHDNRGLPRDASIHRSPWLRQVQLSLGLLPPFLAPGSVTVGHVDDPAVLQQFLNAGICVILVVRDLRSILWSLFRFKLAAVAPLDPEDRHWRSRPTTLERFMGFLAYCWNRDIAHICNCCRTFASHRDLPLLRYEDLLSGTLPEPTALRLEQQLGGSGGVSAFLAAAAAAQDLPTPTQSHSLPDHPCFSAAEETEIRRLIEALVAGSALAEVNALFGYG